MTETRQLHSLGSVVILLVGLSLSPLALAQPAFLLAFKGDPTVGDGNWNQTGCTALLSDERQSLKLRFRYGKIKKSIRYFSNDGLMASFRYSTLTGCGTLSQRSFDLLMRMDFYLRSTGLSHSSTRTANTPCESRR